jgi:hypothetical protein
LGSVEWPSPNCSRFAFDACIPEYSNISSGKHSIYYDTDAASCPKYWHRTFDSGPCDLPWVCTDGVTAGLSRSLVFASMHLIIAFTASFRLLRSRRIPLLRAGFPGRIHALATIAAASFLRCVSGYLTMDPYLHPRAVCHPQNVAFLVVSQLLFNLPIILWCQVVMIMNVFWHSLLAAVDEEIVLSLDYGRISMRIFTPLRLKVSFSLLSVFMLACCCFTSGHIALPNAIMTPSGWSYMYNAACMAIISVLFIFANIWGRATSQLLNMQQRNVETMIGHKLGKWALLNSGSLQRLALRLFPCMTCFDADSGSGSDGMGTNRRRSDSWARAPLLSMDSLSMNHSINSSGSSSALSSNHHIVLALRKLQKQSSLIGTSQALSAGITLFFLAVLGAGSALGGFDSRFCSEISPFVYTHQTNFILLYLQVPLLLFGYSIAGARVVYSTSLPDFILLN